MRSEVPGEMLIIHLYVRRHRSYDIGATDGYDNETYPGVKPSQFWGEILCDQIARWHQPVNGSGSKINMLPEQKIQILRTITCAPRV